MKNYFDTTLSIEQMIEILNGDMSSDLYDFMIKTEEKNNFHFAAFCGVGEEVKRCDHLLESSDVQAIQTLLKKSCDKVWPHGYQAKSVYINPRCKFLSKFELPIALFTSVGFDPSVLKKMLEEYLSLQENLLLPGSDTVKIHSFGSINLRQGKLRNNIGYKFHLLPIYRSGQTSVKKVGVLEGDRHWLAFYHSITSANKYMQDELLEHIRSYEYCSKIDPEITLKESKSIQREQLDIWTLRHVVVIPASLFDEMKSLKGENFLAKLKQRRKAAFIEMNLDLEFSSDEIAYVHPSFILPYKGSLYVSEVDKACIVKPYKGVIDHINRKN